MSKRDTRVYFQDMLEAVQRILGYVDCLDYDSFSADIKTQDAVMRNL